MTAPLRTLLTLLMAWSLSFQAMAVVRAPQCEHRQAVVQQEASIASPAALHTHHSHSTNPSPHEHHAGAAMHTNVADAASTAEKTSQPDGCATRCLCQGHHCASTSVAALSFPLPTPFLSASVIPRPLRADTTLHAQPASRLLRPPIEA